MSQAKRIVVIGAGGKTTLLGHLAGRHRSDRVLLTTTTHIFPFAPPVCDRLCVDPDAQTLAAALSAPGVVCAGRAASQGKLSVLPDGVLDAAGRAADWIFYEADGSKRLPLKLHGPDEPVILPDTSHCLILAGLSAWGKPVCEAVHRYHLREDWAKAPGLPVDETVIADCVMDAVRACGLPHDKLTVLLNQADTVQRAQVRSVVRCLASTGIRCIPCSLRDHKVMTTPKRGGMTSGL